MTKQTAIEAFDRFLKSVADKEGIERLDHIMTRDSYMIAVFVASVNLLLTPLAPYLTFTFALLTLIIMGNYQQAKINNSIINRIKIRLIFKDSVVVAMGVTVFLLIFAFLIFISEIFPFEMNLFLAIPVIYAVVFLFLGGWWWMSEQNTRSDRIWKDIQSEELMANNKDHVNFDSLMLTISYVNVDSFIWSIVLGSNLTIVIFIITFYRVIFEIAFGLILMIIVFDVGVVIMHYYYLRGAPNRSAKLFMNSMNKYV